MHEGWGRERHQESAFVPFYGQHSYRWVDLGSGVSKPGPQSPQFIWVFVRKASKASNCCKRLVVEDMEGYSDWL